MTRDWEAAALCAQADPEAWFPAKGEHAVTARGICRRCPVREPCLQDALADDEPSGIRGGLGPRERRRLKTRRSAAPATPCTPATATRRSPITNTREAVT
ncbi:WhiB family transcriptional regulator [Nonomuraea sp. NPDC050540]|uniref:WhiB family transcriptional regulator n=1 Tax=Nonomuraea sp. NPDC050540 TaxID=3364367 RepID=UPI0037A4194F